MRGAVVLAVVTSLVMALSAQAAGLAPGPPMVQARYAHTATALPDGRVLVAGGPSLSSAEVFDPSTNAWRSVATPTTLRLGHRATLLASGKVLVTGGFFGAARLASTEIFDPATDTWSAAAPMLHPRAEHQATLLFNGEVLVTGGDDTLRVAERYDPIADRWSPAGVEAARSLHTATLLLDGRVLVAGGVGRAAPTLQLDSELYDPVSGAWSPAPPLPRNSYGQTAHRNAQGHVLLLGGGVWGGGCIVGGDRYDPVANTWSRIAERGAVVCVDNSTLLPDGTILAVGPHPVQATIWNAVIFDPRADAWRTVGRLSTGRYDHTETVIGRRVLIAGGADWEGRYSQSTEVLDIDTPESQARLRRSADFDADGTADLAWRNPVTGENQFWLMRDGQPGAAWFVLLDPNWRIAHKALFDGDDATDLLWHNAATGDWSMWLMRDGRFHDGRLLLNDPPWTVTHVGDFNGDGKADLVWHNAATGVTVIWLMDGLSLIGARAILLDPAWQVEHVGDLDGDGKSDLVWRNQATGEYVLWLMDGTAFVAGARPLTGPEWSITDVADTNGDGKADLLWRNTSGDAVLWMMNGLVAKDWYTLPAGGADAHVTHVADFNADHAMDFVWHHDVFDSNTIWLLPPGSGARLVSNIGWSLVCAADFDGDGRADLLWVDQATMAARTWIMDDNLVLQATHELPAVTGLVLQ